MTTCRACGATAPDLAALPPASQSVTASADYRALAGPGADRAFLRWAMLCEPGAERAEALLHAAWALDDQGADAKPLRLRAIEEWREPATMQDGLRLIDICRRAGSHVAAQARAEALLAKAEPGGTDDTLLRYQLGLIAAADEARHLLSSALRPPARTPHVTHGKTVKRGFWQRLTGA